jgi:hypothetical protein
MSAVAIQIDFIGERAEALLVRIEAGLADPSELYRRIAARAENLTRDYLRAIAQESHKTATSLGAKPTGHLERAAENVTSRSDAESATVGVTSAGITRAFRALLIEPKGSGWLTIPMHKLAYGHTVEQVSRAIGQRLFRPLKKGAKAKGSRLAQGAAREGQKGAGHGSKLFDPADRKRALAARIGGKLVMLFALAKRAVIPQDRTLLPANEDYQREAGLAGAEYILDLARARDAMQGGVA